MSKPPIIIQKPTITRDEVIQTVCPDCAAVVGQFCQENGADRDKLHMSRMRAARDERRVKRK